MSLTHTKTNSTNNQISSIENETGQILASYFPYGVVELTFIQNKRAFRGDPPGLPKNEIFPVQSLAGAQKIVESFSHLF